MLEKDVKRSPPGDVERPRKAAEGIDPGLSKAEDESPSSPS
jgi:hypothetical protein